MTRQQQLDQYQFLLQHLDVLLYFNLFVFLEISALSSITLIALGAGFDRRALLAAYNYLIIGALGATLYVIGVGYLYALTGTLNMADFVLKLQTLDNNIIALLQDRKDRKVSLFSERNSEDNIEMKRQASDEKTSLRSKK